jgi:aryl-alcohol dehydrogenase-like predicted oxidoreductase
VEYRHLGNSDLEVSVVGIGCWAMGGTAWGPVDDAECIGAIHRALDLGINFVDTAAEYGLGHSEEVVGQAVAGRRDEVVLATKGGLNWTESGDVFRDSSREHIVKGTEASLRRLNTDVIDLLQIHWPDENVPFEETMAAMLELQQQGKIRAIGLSNFTVEQMQRCLAAGPVESLQPPYSMLRRDIERDILPFCRQHNIGVVVYGPLARGLLTGKYSREPTFTDNDVRHSDGNFRGERFQRNLAMLERLKAIAYPRGKTLAQLAIRWCLSHPAVTVAIVGAKRAAQVEENVGGAGWRLSEEELQKIDRILAT